MFWVLQRVGARALFRESADSIEGQFLSNGRQVTSGFEKAGEGYFSPDGRTIIYQAVPRGYPFYQIYKQSLPDGKPQLVSTGRGRNDVQLLFAGTANI